MRHGIKLLVVLVSAPAWAAVGVWLGPALGVANTTGHLGYTMGIDHRYGGYLGIGLGFDRWNHVVRARYGVVDGAETPDLPSAGVIYTHQQTGGGEKAADFSWEYRLAGGPAGGAVRLLPGFAATWNRGGLDEQRYLVWAGPAGPGDEELTTAHDLVTDWTFVPTFGVEHEFSVVKWSARAGFGLRTHSHEHRFRWDFWDSETGESAAVISEGDSAGLASFVARGDVNARVAFGKHYGVDVALQARGDVYEFGECFEPMTSCRDAERADLGRTDFWVVVTPAFYF